MGSVDNDVLPGVDPRDLVQLGMAVEDGLAGVVHGTNCALYRGPWAEPGSSSEERPLSVGPEIGHLRPRTRAINR